jgi:hypothetical protein
MPLWHLLQTGKTIKEMEEVEARANAINQLTREGAFGFEAEKNAALIAERTEQILAATRDINQQMSISEETLDSSLGLEKEKTAELAKQAEQLAKQEAQRQRAIRDTTAEIALIEAKLTGNKQARRVTTRASRFSVCFRQNATVLKRPLSLPQPKPRSVRLKQPMRQRVDLPPASDLVA